MFKFLLCAVHDKLYHHHQVRTDRKIVNIHRISTIVSRNGGRAPNSTEYLYETLILWSTEWTNISLSDRHHAYQAVHLLIYTIVV